jgi:hypothetical protein
MVVAGMETQRLAQRLELVGKDVNDRITPFKAITENLRELPRSRETRRASRAD